MLNRKRCQPRLVDHRSPENRPVVKERHNASRGTGWGANPCEKVDLAATSVSAAITTEVEIAVAAADWTTTVTGGDTLPAKGPFALKATVIECEPTPREAVLKIALPSDCMPNVPNADEPS
jgi:hypothetical protein